jgi:hypothetical protein
MDASNVYALDSGRGCLHLTWPTRADLLAYFERSRPRGDFGTSLALWRGMTARL